MVTGNASFRLMLLAWHVIKGIQHSGAAQTYLWSSAWTYLWVRSPGLTGVQQMSSSCASWSINPIFSHSFIPCSVAFCGH